MKFDTSKLGRQQLHDLIGNAIAPLPIAFITTVGEDGSFNASPFSFTTPITSKPPVICVSIARRQGQKKDTVRNIEASQDFVINIVDEKMIKQAVQASADYPAGVDEMKKVGLIAVKSDKVKAPRIAESKINLECRLVHIFETPEEGNALRSVIFGEVVQIHVKDEVLTDGEIDPAKLKAVGRVGRNMYCRTTDVFEAKKGPVS